MNERLNAVVGAKISEFKRKMAEVNQSIRSLPNNTVVRVRAVTSDATKRLDNFGAKIDKLATRIRSFGTVFGNMFKGGMFASLPALSPIIATLTGGLGSLLPILGTAGGGMLGLGSAATSAVGGLGVYAKLFGEVSSQLINLEANLKTGGKAFNNLHKYQQEGILAIKEFKGVWKDFRLEFHKPISETFTTFMEVATSGLKQLMPAMRSTVKGVDNLANSLKEAVNGSGAKAFFEWMGNTAGTYIERLGKTIGNLIAGFGNLMVAFDPLADSMTTGLLDMTARFNDWSASIQGSKAMQGFISYIQTNGPKLLDIFGNIVMGLVGMGQAFAPMSADMLTGFQKMTEKFQQWGQALSENQQFQKFVGYIRENAPKVIDLIGNMTTFLVELGKGMAPLGSRILDIVNGFLGWTSSMMKANPIIGQAIAVVISLGGILLALIPGIIAVRTAFAGLGTFIWTRTAMMRAKLALGISMMIKSLANFIVQMVVTVAKFIAQSVIFIARWALMGTKALLHGARVAAAWLLTTGVNMVVALAKMTVTSALFIAKWLLMGTKAMLHAAKVAAAWLLTTGANMAVAVAKMVATSAVFIAKWALIGAKSLLHAAKVAAAWFIALGPVGWVIATVIALVALVIANWDKVKSWTQKIWSAVSQFISNAANKILGYIQKNFPALYNVIQSYMTAAKNIISSIWNFVKSIFSSTLSFLKALVTGDFQGMKDAINSAMTAAKTLISNIWNAVKSFFNSVLGSIWSTVKSKFSDIVNSVREKMTEVKAKVEDLWGEVESFLEGIDLMQMGKDIIQGLINGIKSMAGDVVKAAKGVVGDAIDGAKNLLGINSPSKVFFQFGKWTDEGLINGINSMTGKVASTTRNLASIVSNSFKPQLAMADFGATATIDSSLNGNMGAIQHAFSAEVNDFELPEKLVNIYIEGDAEWIRAYVNEENAIEDTLRKF